MACLVPEASHQCRNSIAQAEPMRDLLDRIHIADDGQIVCTKVAVAVYRHGSRLWFLLCSCYTRGMYELMAPKTGPDSMDAGSSPLTCQYTKKHMIVRDGEFTR